MTRACAGPIVALTAFLCGCEAVPSLTFLDAAPDAVDEAPSPAVDAGLDACAVPRGQTQYICCGTVACAHCTSDMCGLCANQGCMQGEFCCAKVNAMSGNPMVMVGCTQGQSCK